MIISSRDYYVYTTIVKANNYNNINCTTGKNNKIVNKKMKNKKISINVIKHTLQNYILYIKYFHFIYKFEIKKKIKINFFFVKL